MSTCCPNCAATAFGTDAASICADCATATVAGTTFSVPMILAAAAGAAAIVLTIQAARMMMKRTLPQSPTLA